MVVAASVLLSACDDGADVRQPAQGGAHAPAESSHSGGDRQPDAAANGGGDDASEPPEESGDATETPAAEHDAADDGGSAASDAAGPSAALAESDHRLDLEQLFIDDAPVAERDVSPAVDAALDRVRAAMRNRDFRDVRLNLQDAASRLKNDEDRAAYEEMLLVHAWWVQGWDHATAAARLLKVGDKLDIWSGPAVVERTSESEVVLNLDGSPRAFAIRSSDMDLRLAVALLSRRASATGLGLDPHRAALLVLDRESTPEAARNACVDAVQRGYFIDPLLSELRKRP